MQQKAKRAKSDPLKQTAPVKAAAPPVWRSVVLFVVLLGVMLAAWRLVLLEPMLAAARSLIESTVEALPFEHSAPGELITLADNRDWVVHAARLALRERQITIQIAGRADAGVRAQPAMLQCFFLCLPIFWALALAARPGRGAGRTLGIGTLVLAAVAQLSLMLFLAYWVNRYFAVASSPWTEYVLNFGGYFALNVAPYVSPVIVVIWLDRELRARLLGGSTWRIPPAPPA